jgi:hypothetical protein
LDTFYGALSYWDRPDLVIESAVGNLADQAVSAGAGIAGQIGSATVWLFDGPAVVRALTTWIEQHFTATPGGPRPRHADSSPANVVDVRGDSRRSGHQSTRFRSHDHAGRFLTTPARHRPSMWMLTS